MLFKTSKYSSVWLYSLRAADKPPLREDYSPRGRKKLRGRGCRHGGQTREEAGRMPAICLAPLGWCLAPRRWRVS